ncbi:hypothetical protein [Streptomyces candidus]|uniref:Uncharacterized protein n=1 Tax=Streptomyces candidus TaxID=67283 RepID=A0A7X0HLR8_9ACTN|nr:hypothetical protein [Streptomyces candidus]MBB6439886.1 hypothetical protein [Streptomyces candidus]GHH58009.1 hypothetical protein GCM10018773_65970 [Streptomyces candidus]
MTTQLQISAPTPGTVNPAAGERAKRKGMAKVRQLDPEWSARCDEKIAEFAARGVVFQAADLIEAGLDEPPHPNCWGTRFAAAARAGIVRHAGYGQSKRATVHRSICHQWVGTGRRT